MTQCARYSMSPMSRTGIRSDISISDLMELVLRRFSSVSVNAEGAVKVSQSLNGEPCGTVKISVQNEDGQRYRRYQPEGRNNAAVL